MKNLILIISILFGLIGLTQTTNLYVEDFESHSVGYVTSTTNTNQTWTYRHSGHSGCASSDDWYVGSSGGYGSNSNISGKYANIDYGSSGCYQDISLRTKVFTPTKSSINVSFDWAFKDYTSSTIIIRLYTLSGTQVHEFVNTGVTNDGSINTSVSVTAGESYYIDFRYDANWDYGAKIDNILVTESSSGGGGSGGTVDVTIGTGTSSSGEVPSYGLFEYSWSGMIYKQSEINNEGLIQSISFYVDASSPSSYVMSNQKIYLGHTTYSQFPNSSVQEDFVGNYVSTDWTLVYDGSIDWVPGWKTITLDTTFNYNNTDNLIVKVENRSGYWAWSYPEFDYTSSSRGASFNYQDGSYPTSTGDRTSNRPNIKFNINTAAPLPVELVSFTGTLLEEQIAVLLKWLTTTEKNNDYFTVWRSFDGYSWDIINITHGAGNSQQILEYIYLDRNPNTGINYYNLSQTDLDGNTEFFGIISVDVDILSARHYITKTYNLLGQEVDENYVGPKILVWDNGDVEKRY